MTHSNRSMVLDETKKLAHRIIHVPKSGFLFREQEDATEFYIVKSGLIQISKLTENGKELTLRCLSAEACCGELTLFAIQPKYLFNAKALEDSEIYAVKIERIEQMILSSNPEFVREFMIMINEHMRKQHTKFRDLVLYGKKGALYSTLIRMANSYGVEVKDGILIDLKIKNQELANYCGTSRERVNRMLNELAQEGILSLPSRQIIIHDLEKLKQLNHCEDCPISVCVID